MSTKLSLLSRSAAVAGLLAIALPAFAAETTQPVAPTSTAPAITAPAVTKPVEQKTTGEVNIDKDKKHVETKDMTKVSDKIDSKHAQPAQAPVAAKPDAAVKSDVPAATK